MITYLICTTMRTGSNLLCQYLTDTGLAGRPLDYSSKWYLDQYGVDEPGCHPMTVECAKEMTEKYFVNGVFGMKVGHISFRDQILNNELDKLFPEAIYIYVDRIDKVAQIVSMAKAFQTGLYMSTQKYFDPNLKIEYSKAEIDEYDGFLKQWGADWEKYFDRNRIAPLRLFYEDLVATPKAVVKFCLEFIGVSVPEKFILPPAKLTKMADSESKEWCTNYRAEKELE